MKKENWKVWMLVFLVCFGLFAGNNSVFASDSDFRPAYKGEDDVPGKYVVSNEVLGAADKLILDTAAIAQKQEDGKSQLFSFTPEEDGLYYFTSSDGKYSECVLYEVLDDTNGYDIDSSKDKLLSTMTDIDEGTEFPVSRELKKGHTYYFRVDYFGNNSDRITIKVINQASLTPVSVTINHASAYCPNVYYAENFDGKINMTINYKNGEAYSCSDIPFDTIDSEGYEEYVDYYGVDCTHGHKGDMIGNYVNIKFVDDQKINDWKNEVTGDYEFQAVLYNYKGEKIFESAIFTQSISTVEKTGKAIPLEFGKEYSNSYESRVFEVVPKESGEYVIYSNTDSSFYFLIKGNESYANRIKTKHQIIDGKDAWPITLEKGYIYYLVATPPDNVENVTFSLTYQNAEKETTTGSQKTNTSLSNTQKISITLDGVSHNIAAGKKIKLKATVLPVTASNQKLIWTSSNPKVATVTQTGVVTVKKKTGGKSVKITATVADGNGISASWKIKSMKGVVKKVTVSGAKTVKAGKSLKLKAKVTATKGANKKLKWASSNTKYATVSSTGTVKTFKAGKGKKVKITAMATDGSGKKKTVTIKIK